MATGLRPPSSLLAKDQANVGDDDNRVRFSGTGRKWTSTRAVRAANLLVHSC